MQHYALILAYSRVPLLFEYMLTGMYLSSIYVHKISFTLTSGDLVCQGKVALGNLSFTIRELQNSHHDTPWWVWGLEHFLNEHYPCGLVQHGMPCRIHVGVLFQYMTIFWRQKSRQIFTLCIPNPLDVVVLDERCITCLVIGTSLKGLLLYGPM